MNTNTLEMLDFFRVRATVAGYCKSVEAKELLEQRMPFTELQQIQNHKDQSIEWQKFLNFGIKNPLRGFEPIHPFFNRLSKDGHALELSEIYSLGIFCKITKDVKSTFNKNLSDETNKNTQKFLYPILSEMANNIPSLEMAENAIFHIVDEKGELKDLPEIRAIKANIKKIRQDIDSTIKSYTNNVELKDALQSELPVLRQDRQVLAIKANHRGKVKGIVHEVSGTGQTVFIEPEDIVRKNNDLVQEEFKLFQEIKRILKDLTKKLNEYKDDFEIAHKIILDFDTSYAVARYGIEHNAIFADTCKGVFQSPILKQARHPLLGSKAIPIDVEFSKEANDGKGHRVLIITGPNTGGKTVTLKTIALLSMLNQSGFPVTAQDGSVFPIFTNIFADIGDEQSLDESLSTFSGHMKNIANAVKNADKNSLVLLDELGSGTDPQEGGAIAMSVLDELIKKDAFVLATTHHGILKNYGYTHPSCVNASVEFDSETLSPTYRVLMGIPGESHALDIAKRSGLPDSICKIAEDYITNKKADVSALIKGLNEKHEEIAKIEAEIRDKERRVNDKWRKIDLKDLRLKQKEFELREIGYRKSQNFLSESRKMLENLVRELREGELNREKTVKVKKTIAELEKAVEEEKQNLKENEALLLAQSSKSAEYSLTGECPTNGDYSANGEYSATGKYSPTGKYSATGKYSTTGKYSPTGAGSAFMPPVESATLKPGFEVAFGKNKTRGILIAKGKGDTWNIQVGSMKVFAKENEIVLLSTGGKTEVSVEVDKTPMQTKEVFSDGRMTFGVKHTEKPLFELRLLGMRYEEAVKALEHQLDLCVINNFKSFSVIHGKGNGILQEAVQNCLKRYSFVKEFHFASPEDGGFGKTYVTLE